MLNGYGKPVLGTLPPDLSSDTSEGATLDSAGNYSDHIADNGPFTSGDTLFAVGHYTEDRDVWFDILTVTTDDIMRECGIPESERDEQRSLNRCYAELFLRFHDGPERTIPLLED